MNKLSIRINRSVKGIMQSAGGNAQSGRWAFPDEGNGSAVNVNDTNFTLALENTRKTANRSGYLEGLAEGRREAGQAVAIMQQEFVELLENYNLQYQRIIDKLHIPFLQLALNVAEKLVISQIQEAGIEAFLTKQINSILTDFSDQHSLTIRINPESIKNLEKESFLSQLQLSPKIKVKIIEDLSLSDVGCIVESEDFVVDLSLEKQLDLLKQEFLNGQ